MLKEKCQLSLMRSKQSEEITLRFHVESMSQSCEA